MKKFKNNLQKINAEVTHVKSFIKRNRSSSTKSSFGLKKYIKHKRIYIPKTSQQCISYMFKDIHKDIFQINDDEYSLCMEYDDISFSKASQEHAETIYLKWLDFLHSFSTDTHITVTNAGSPILSDAYKAEYTIDSAAATTTEQKQIQQEFNTLIGNAIGNKKYILKTKRYITISMKIADIENVQDIFFDLYMKTVEKFKGIHSNVRVVPMKERLTFLHDFWNTETAEEKHIGNIQEYARTHDLTVYDVMAPHAEISMRKSDIINIGNKKFIRILYMDPKMPNSLSPKFYNTMTLIDDVNLIITQNIQPTKPAKAIKRVSKQLSAMETERLTKVKKLAKSNINYALVPDKRLETGIKNANTLMNDIQFNDQRIFKNNMLFCITAASQKELDIHTKKVIEKAAEMLIHLNPMHWQQLEGVQHVLPLGHNTIQFQRTMTSEATAVHVPFNSRDFTHKHALFGGTNIVSNKAIFYDRKQLLNGNGCVLATSGSGKSFAIKMMIEQIMLCYPDDDIILIDYQREYSDIMDIFNGQTITISDTSDTHINPFDLDINYDLKEKGKGSPIKSKTEYLLALCACLKEEPLSAKDKTIIDRCTNIVYQDFVKSGYKDKTKKPLFADFQKVLLAQPEPQAKDLALILERFITGSLDMFAYETNINIKSRLARFDTHEMPESMDMAGYLVIMDHIINRLAANKQKNKFTWIFFEEFHILLENVYAAKYVAKIYKVGRKLNAMNTIITQNISDMLDNKQGRKILSNSEFALILKQKPLDKADICGIFNISKEESRYIDDDASAGHGILVFGNENITFKNNVPVDNYLYKINNTDSVVQTR